MVKFFPVDPGHLREELTRYSTCSVTVSLQFSVFAIAKHVFDSSPSPTPSCLRAGVVLSIERALYFTNQKLSIFI